MPHRTLTLRRYGCVMSCRYCGNAYLPGGRPRCEGCGAPKTAAAHPLYRDADALYAEVGHALITGEANSSRALLDRILGSPKKDPKQLWIERSAKIGLCLGLLYFLPWLLGMIAVMIVPFAITIYLPYLGLKSLMGWIASDGLTDRR